MTYYPLCQILKGPHMTHHPLSHAWEEFMTDN
jgi:hypothetical protein